jgi:hypothetical protein
MKRKSLLFGLLAVLAAVFIFIGCANPSDGATGLNGGNGQNGFDGVTWSGTTLTAGQLAILFEESSRVLAITSSAATIEGVIPPNKTLVIRVVGGTSGVFNVVDTGTASLTVQGTLDLEEGSTLDASALSATAGRLILEGGNITGLGRVYLPVKTTTTAVFDGLDYVTSTFAGKVAKSAVTGSTAAVALTAVHVADVFNNEVTDDLVAENVTTAIVSATIPKTSNKLTLLGASNTFAPVSGRFEPVGEVIVKGTLTTSGGGTIIIPAETTSKLTIEAGGTLALAAADTVDVSRGAITNSGTITTSTTTLADLTTLLALSGGGTISSGGVVNLGSATLPLAQNLLITAAAIAPTHASSPLFSGTGKITVGTGGSLTFVLIGGGLGLAGPIETTGTGTVNTATATDDTVLKTLLNGVQGTIVSSGNITTIASPGLTIPPGVTLNATGGTFEYGAFPVVINGAATFTAATFDAATSIEVNTEAPASTTFTLERIQ